MRRGRSLALDLRFSPTVDFGSMSSCKVNILPSFLHRSSIDVDELEVLLSIHPCVIHGRKLCFEEG